MSAYAVGHLRNVRMGPGIITYLQGIDATIEPYQGRFIIHGDRPLVKEGNWTGDLIVIEFPDLGAGPCLVSIPGISGHSGIAGR